MKVTIKIFRESQDILSRVVEEGVYRFGRSEFCDFILDDKSVSRSHLEVRVTSSSVYVTNMSSNNHVYINGKKLETAEIADGDEIKLGVFRILMQKGEHDEIAPPAEVQIQDEISPQHEEGAVSPLVGLDVGSERAPKADVENNNDEGIDAQSAAQLVPEGEAAVPANALGGGELQLQPSLNRAPNQEGTALHGETQLEIKPIVAKLMFTEGPKAGEELFVETFEVTLGRSKKADIFLDDDKLSRIHAKITRVGMGYRLIDMNSRNGTYVNGMRILEHPLNSFDEIQIGHSKIKFLIHDVMASAVQQGHMVAVASAVHGSLAFEQTKSVQIDALPKDVMLELQRPSAGGTHPPPPLSLVPDQPLYTAPARSKRTLVLIVGVLLLALGYFLIPTGGQKPESPSKDVTSQSKSQLDATKLPSSVPKEFAQLSPEQQRQIEGYYNSAVQAANQEQFEDAEEYIRKIHSALPFYKNSRELMDTYIKKVKEKQIADAQKRAKEDEKQDLKIYLEDGLEYLKAGDFDRAAESFNSAIVIDPTNGVATKGLRAAEAKITDINAVPPDSDAEAEKRKLVAELFHKAATALTSKAYQDAINTAEKIKLVDIKGDNQYLNEARQIIDRAHMLQKEEFEPFLIQAKEKYAEADYMASREMCEEMEKRDPSYEEAKDCAAKARKQLNRLAKEAYTYGYILESMNRIEEAKQYWNRAKNFVRKGDPYYDKINKKLDYYQ